MARIDAVSAKTGLAKSTIGRLVGQGGTFYRRLASGARVWPETAASVFQRLEDIENG